ncbi:MAG: glycosyltransferase family 9 protein [Leptolyngbyaceae bacterium]|nr:glycosyltransferase family 9 protein [Leptolyngbyaceae bacterium]
MRIVALVPGGIGDQVLFFPTLTALNAAYPQADSDVIVEPRSMGAYRVCKLVSSVMPFDFRARSSPADWANLLGILRDRYYDIVLYSGQQWGIDVLLWLTGIPQRVSYANSLGQGFLTHAISPNPDQYAAAMYHDLLKGLGLTTACPPLSINVPRGDVEWAEAERSRLHLDEGGYVLIHSGACPLSQSEELGSGYPVASWQAIVQDFQQRQPDLPVVVAKSPADTTLVPELTSVAPGLKVVEPSDLGKLAAMIAGASLMICPNGVPMQLAVAIQVYTLALFGPTDPATQLPQDEKFVGIKSPTDQLSDITPEMVLKRVWGE